MGVENDLDPGDGVRLDLADDQFSVPCRQAPLDAAERVAATVGADPEQVAQWPAQSRPPSPSQAWLLRASGTAATGTVRGPDHQS